MCGCVRRAQGDSGEMICERLVLLTADSTGKQESAQKAGAVLFSSVKRFASVIF